MRRGSARGAQGTAYRDDREALRERVAQLEREVEDLRLHSDVGRLREELAATKGIVRTLIQVQPISRGAMSEGAPRLITWHFCVKNTGATTIRLIEGQTDWCVDLSRGGGRSLVSLLDAPMKSTFTDQPELAPGEVTDDYKLKLDTSLPAFESRLGQLGLALEIARSQVRPVIRIYFESVAVQYSDSTECLLEP